MRLFLHKISIFHDYHTWIKLIFFFNLAGFFLPRLNSNYKLYFFSFTYNVFNFQILEDNVGHSFAIKIMPTEFLFKILKFPFLLWFGKI